MSHDLGMSENYIFNIESDYAYPTMTIFFAICEYLDVTPKEFFDWEP
jgi:transcriptional regulator with XRE-family HTH domain